MSSFGFERLGVGHAYAPGHEPSLFERLAAVDPGSLDPASLLLAIPVAAALIGIAWTSGERSRCRRRGILD